MKKRYKIVAISVIFAMVAIGFSAYFLTNKVKRFNSTQVKLGTVVKLDVWSKDAAIIDTIYARLDDIEQKMSINIEGSEISNLNRNGWANPIAISSDSIDVLTTALEYAKLSDGYFDITIGPVSKLWGIGTDKANIPDSQTLATALSHVGYEKVKITGNSVKLTEKDMVIDLGGIAKGYASDEIVKLLDDAHIERALINLGGNVYAKGDSPDHRPWSIGLQDPFKAQGNYFGIAKVSNKTVVSSGNYERFFTQDGKRYHHILNPFSGYPIENDVAMVTIIGDSSMEADALSTTLFALGAEKGIALINQNSKDFEAIIVTKDKRLFLSDGASAYFELTSKEFTYGTLRQ